MPGIPGQQVNERADGSHDREGSEKEENEKKEVFRRRWNKVFIKEAKIEIQCLPHHRKGFFQLEECGLWTSKCYLGKHLARLSTGEVAAEHRTSMFCSRPSLNIYVLQFGILLCSEHCKRKTALT